MNIKTAIIRAAVQLLAANTNVIREETPAEAFINSMFGMETPQERVARETEAAVDKTVAAMKKMSTNRKFKKIVQNV